MASEFYDRYYDRQGNVITMDEWIALIEPSKGGSPAYKRVAFDEFPGGVEVSTVWLGLNHAFRPGPPLIFETMIFGGPHNEYQVRYTTEEEARQGHEVACQLVRDSALPPWETDEHGNPIP